MFDPSSGYDFEYRGVSTYIEGYPCERHTYVFVNREGHTYVVWADEFDDCHLFGIKYFRGDYYDKIDQFSVILNTNDYLRVVSTVLNIMVEIYNNQPLASFIFQGANSDDESEGDTQRYRVWSLATKNNFPPHVFEYLSFDKKSVFLIRNRACTLPIISNIDDILKHHGVVF